MHDKQGDLRYYFAREQECSQALSFVEAGIRNYAGRKGSGMPQRDYWAIAKLEWLLSFPSTKFVPPYSRGSVRSWSQGPRW